MTGFSLLQLLLAIALSVFLIAASLQAYLAGAAALRRQAASAQLDVDGYRALQLLTRELRMAGFLGGAQPAQIAVPADAPDCTPGDRWPLTPGRPLVLNHDDLLQATPALACLPLTSLLPQAELLVVQRVDGAASWGPASAWRGREPDSTQWYLAVDRYGSARFHWADRGVPRSPPDADTVNYWAYHARIFYLRDYAASAGDGLPTLCVERLMGRGMRSECLVEGVEDLQLDLLVDDDADGMPERIADVHGGTAAGVATHVLVRVSLRSADALSTRRVQAPEARTLPAAPLSADGYLRRSYSMTVALRNNRSAS